MTRNPAGYAIGVGGLVGGAIDITYATTWSYVRGAVPPTRILQSVASGLFGNSAFYGGSTMAVLGLLLHFMNAFIWAAIFYMAARRVPDLTKHAVLAGVLYGLVIFGGMYFVVLPMSAFPRPVTFPLATTASGIFVHMFGIGLPMSLAARKALSPSAA